MLSIKNINLLRNMLLKQIITLLFIFFNSLSFGLGLGDLKVYSHLNEPLNAEIELNDIDDLAPSSIIAELANPKDFILTGIPRPNYLTTMKFEVKKVNDKLIIRLFTTQAVKNPFMDFLVQVVWPEGRTLKNYTILLDPEDFQEENNIKNPVKKSQATQESVLEKEKLFVSQREESLSNESLSDSTPEESENKLLFETKQKTNKNMDSISTEDEVHSYAVNKDDGDPFMLNKVISSLQSFSDESNRQKITYDKLFNQRSNDISPIKDQDPYLKPSDAMQKINSELNLENKENSIETKDQKDIKDISVSSNPIPDFNNNLNKLTSMELLIKHSNDLLWAFCLVIMIVFLFYKMIVSSYQPEHFAFNTQQANNLTYDINYANEPVEVFDNTKNNNNNNLNNLNKMASIDQNKTIDRDFSSNLDLNVPHFSLNEINPPIEANTVSHVEKKFNNNTLLDVNEELELKIALAKQYLEVKDQKSAKDILQGINISKAQLYKDQIIALLKIIDV